MSTSGITIEGARQNNLKNLDLSLPYNELIVVTGVSGSGKSSLAFDTIYAEGQRRYVETFSPYARQFLDRMDKPHTDRIDGIPPAIAIDQTNPVRTSRSTVGTMTELNDHLKLLFARAARLVCRGCGRPVRRDSAATMVQDLVRRSAADPGVSGWLITFPVPVPENFTVDEVKGLLAKQGYHRLHSESARRLEVVQDRIAAGSGGRGRLVEALEAALHYGQGRADAYPLRGRSPDSAPARYSDDLHCPDCDIHYRDPAPNHFSFNSPLGACETCRGFGRTIGIDDDLVVPDPTRTLRDGAVKPWQSKSYRECQEDLERFARRRGVPLGAPWQDLTEAQRQWVLRGEGSWDEGKWYGVDRFFEWLEGRSYKMHVRVLLSRYRTYRPCPACGGARLRPESLLWRVGPGQGLNLPELMAQPIAECLAFFTQPHWGRDVDDAAAMVAAEIRTRLEYLAEVGLGYLTLDRQSRTLSGGEVQRINLTTALGTSLVNTLFVLDEPSIGLHSRDIRRLVGVLHRLRDAGNTLIVVEHDPEVIRAADRIIDMGPGPGARGGSIVFQGTLPNLLRSRRSMTAVYLTGRQRIELGGTHRTAPAAEDPALEIQGAAEHNLRGIDVRIPLHRLVCVTGVSGSGKSTLLHDVLYLALCKLKRRPQDAPGRHRAILGHEQIQDVVMVDQSPIGKTTRSNPASYVGAFQAIRALFAAEPLSKERGYTAGTFSFNAGHGRCPACSGNGFEHVEMQFLSDVYLRCPDCDGRRYRREILDVRLLPPAGTARAAVSVADVLDMTVDETCAFFAGEAEVIRTLAPLRDVGLGYVQLGQPVPTLSGGEAQRLKLAGHLAKAPARSTRGRGFLFLFDEPTTGLHFQDIAVLLQALQRLVEAGHSVVVIEHNLDLIRAADWVLDLGPEGGGDGGRLVAEGPPAAIEKCKHSHTGAALRAYRKNQSPAPRAAKRAPRAAPKSDRVVRIRRAREHNLQNLDLTIPRDAFTVITGISGSGKSTVAFDILFAEGQRRYLESLNAYARQFVQPASRPDVDAMFGIPPTVAIEQRTSRGGRKSTVATVTELYHFLRLLFVKLGVQYCPRCDRPIEPQTADAVAARLLRDYAGRRITVLAPLVTARKGYYTDLAAWAEGKGFTQLRVDGALTPTTPWPRLDRFTEHTIELPVGDVAVSAAREPALRELLARALQFGRGVVQAWPAARGRGRRPKPQLFSTVRACPGCGQSFDALDPRMFSFNSRHGWCPDCEGTGLAGGEDSDEPPETSDTHAPCRTCRGRRLRPESLAVRWRDRDITHYTGLPVEAAARFFAGLRLRGRDEEIARDPLHELRSRLQFLANVGLGYLTLDRPVPTLSGGEAQRIRLASQLGSNLRGVCYILDEPTIGLHARDNRMLLNTLKQLRAQGNMVVVVEHDEDTIREADHLIDLGPGAGRQGGRLVAEGSVRDLMRNPASLTGRMLATPLAHPLMQSRRDPQSEHSLFIRGASLHNLAGIDVRIPLGRLVCVTGVSGSGKSTLVRDILHTNLQTLARAARSRRRSAPPPPRGCKSLEGAKAVGRILEVDQTPIGKTPRSCPATYVGFWNDIRKLYAQSTEARIRGYTAARFSFNVAGGRCEACAGQGATRIEMSFLPDVSIPCDTCNGRRFTPETLGVLYNHKSIADVLAMSVDEAAPFFAAHPPIQNALQIMQDVGLGYLTLGQQSPTLSGGEAQRIKLVTELAKVRPDSLQTHAPGSRHHALYILDEPTIGLHMADVERLIRVLHRLVDAGHTVVLIEHNLDVIAEADWILDLGPEGGDLGGRLVAQGTPETLAKSRTHTGHALKRHLQPKPPRTRAKAKK